MVGYAKNRSRALPLLGVLVLLSCRTYNHDTDVYAPKAEGAPLPSPHAIPPRAVAAPRVAVRGATNPAECLEPHPPLPESERDLDRDRIVTEGALTKISACGKRLEQPGHILASLRLDADGRVAKVGVVGSSIPDCLIVECVRTQLEKLQNPSGKPKKTRSKMVAVELSPGGRARSLPNLSSLPPERQASFCGDPSDAIRDEVGGRLPPQVIQHIVRNRYPEIRKCYEMGLAVNPNLKGRIVTRFIIGRDGLVSGAHIVENEIPDCRVTECVREAIAGCVFPRPEDGTVAVVYPIKVEPE